MAELFDNATSEGTQRQLASPLGASDVVANVNGPASTALQASGGQFRAIIIDTTTGNHEYVIVTGGQWANQWQIERGAENSTPLDFPAGSIIKHVLTVGGLQNIIGGGIQQWNALPTDFLAGWSGTIYIARQGVFIGYQMSISFAGLLAPADGIQVCNNAPAWTIGVSDTMTGSAALVFDDTGQRDDVMAFPLLHGAFSPITLDLKAPASLTNPTFDISATFPATTA